VTPAEAVLADPGTISQPRLRLALVASHPVQYQAPWYRALAAIVDLQVFFAHRMAATDHARAGFGVEFDWDVPVLDGFEYMWLDNVAARPGVDHFRGCDTPGVASTIERGRFDALLVNGWQLLAYWQAIRAARRAGIAVMVRGDSHLATTRGAVRRSAKRVLYPRLLEAFDAYLAVGDRNEAYYRFYGAPASRIYRSPHCVDNEFFARSVDAARAIPGGARRAFGIPGDAIVFAFAGKFIEQKRPLDFLAALDAIRDVQPHAWGLLAGDGPLRDVMEEHRRRHGTRCTMIGFLNQQRIATAYAAADALVLPSRDETWGLVVNEAMACGVPAIVSDQVGCAPDLIAEGETGFSFPCGDVAALAGRMRWMAEHRELGRAMRGPVLRRIAGFSPQAAAAGVIRAMEASRRDAVART
jgi:glycosyltransferase involved in cell wall biosynthesis